MAIRRSTTSCCTDGWRRSAKARARSGRSQACGAWRSCPCCGSWAGGWVAPAPDGTSLPSPRASPYAIRYATETRMYAMVMVLVLAGWLVLDDALHRPARWHLPARGPYRSVALDPLLGDVAARHGWPGAGRAGRHGAWAGDADRWVAIRNAITVLVIGGLTFVPWLPSLLYQGSLTRARRGLGRFAPPRWSPSRWPTLAVAPS